MNLNSLAFGTVLIFLAAAMPFAGAASTVNKDFNVNVAIIEDFQSLLSAGDTDHALISLTSTQYNSVNVHFVFTVNTTANITASEFNFSARIGQTQLSCAKPSPLNYPYPRNFERWDCKVGTVLFNFPAFAAFDLDMNFSLSPAATPQDEFNYTLDIIAADFTPPRIISMVINPALPAGLGNHSFNATFNEDMDNSTPPTVTFGPSGTGNAIAPNLSAGPNGWSDRREWHGIFTITSSSPAGINRIIAKGAMDIASNPMTPNVTVTFIVDPQPPQIKAAFAPNISEPQDLTVSVDSFDRHTGIDSVSVSINPDFSLDFSFRRGKLPLEFILPGGFVQLESWFANITSGILSPGNHTATFTVKDRAGNENSSNVSFQIDGPNATAGGTIAFMCRNNPVSGTCNFGIEDEVIAWLQGRGWTVDVKKYNAWTEAELAARDVIACSDEVFACSLTSTKPAFKRHRLFGQPFIEIPNSKSAMAGWRFGYLASPGVATSPLSTTLFITRADTVTSGHFGSQPIFTPAKTVGVVQDSSLRQGAIDMADYRSTPPTGLTADMLGKSAFFRVDEGGTHGKYLWLGWFSSGALPAHLNAKGSELFEKSASWAQCGNPMGCV